MVIAKWLIVLVAVWNFGGFVVDPLIPITAKQHLHNPRWPPHAKFHNCQTMVIGIFLGLISLWILFAMPLTFSRICLAAGVSGTYFVSMLFAPMFPGTAWHDPEFIDLDPMVLGMSAQKLVALIVCTLLLCGCIFAYAGRRTNGAFSQPSITGWDGTGRSHRVDQSGRLAQFGANRLNSRYERLSVPHRVRG